MRIGRLTRRAVPLAAFVLLILARAPNAAEIKVMISGGFNAAIAT